MNSTRTEGPANGDEPVASRPFMPEYGLLDADDGSGLLPWRRVGERMAEAHNYWIGSTRPDGRPHAMPVWGIWLDETFYFGTGRQSRKGRNLAANPAVVVHLESGDDVLILEGEVQEVTDRALLERYADAYDAKYQFRPDPDEPGSLTYALRPRVVFAWLESDFIGSATRWHFDPAA